MQDSRVRATGQDRGIDPRGDLAESSVCYSTEQTLTLAHCVKAPSHHPPAAPDRQEGGKKERKPAELRVSHRAKLCQLGGEREARNSELGPPRAKRLKDPNIRTNTPPPVRVLLIVFLFV